MSSSLQRSISSLAVLAALVAAAVAVSRFPGAGGIDAELHWLLARDYTPARNFSRASLLILEAEQRQRGARDRLFSRLLSDDDRRVVRGTLVILSDQLRPSGAANQGLREVYSRWFARTPVQDKIDYLPYSLICGARSAGRAAEGDPPLAAVTPLTKNWAPALNEEDWSWIVAATLERNPDAREVTQILLFRSRAHADSIVHRLQYLDGLTSLKYPDPLDPDHKLAPMLADSLRSQCRLGHDRLLAMLSDPVARVRWAAGRILAVAGDARGLPTFNEWLQANRQATIAADAIMADLFGSEWRKRLESSDSTREPRAGDG